MYKHANHFPNNSDIETLIQDGSFKKIKSLMSEEGVFYQGNKTTASEHISRFVFGKEIYYRAFDTLVKAAYGMSISGIRAFLTKSVDLEELFRDQIGVVNQRHKYRPRILDVLKLEADLEVEVEYTRLNPKLSEFYRKEIHKVKFEVCRLDDAKVEFRALPKDSVDSLVTRDVIMNSLQKIGADAISTDIEDLPIKFRVKLFDDMINMSRSASWRVEEVCGLSISAGDDPDQDETELADAKMKVLQSAILKGSNLRDHPIVENLIADGYYFSSISFWARDPSIEGSLDQFRVNIEFKRRPQVLVVNVADCRTPDLGAESQMEYKAIPTKSGRSCIKYYWNLVHQKYDENKLNALEHSLKIIRKSE